MPLLLWYQSRALAVGVGLHYCRAKATAMAFQMLPVEVQQLASQQLRLPGHLCVPRALPAIRSYSTNSIATDVHPAVSELGLHRWHQGCHTW